ncbi:universal stress protein [Bizionia paragorgiae]|uniref:Nucleotide-binding universal stress protein, UspA family n=1 Tax=Bizionia paragorgiae TaxID=283786 RepID=A0A1H3WLH4_BIZPA|nr:universal stress protein [Bizionia paragorgiae]SDZ87038.1 Nucleotide-binding universal stress protein, UspA family [Bizionia paragorgiae]
MRHHILLPTDFSDNAMSAALYAINLYKNESCTFYFLHAWSFSNSSTRTYISSTYIDKLETAAKQQLVELQEQYQKDSGNADHNFEIIFSTEPLVKTIEEAVKAYPVNFIVMGTNGASGASKFLFGSNAVGVINKIKSCPILVIPSDYKFVKTDRIAFPTDFNRMYGEEIEPIKQFAKLHNAKISVFHISKGDDLSEKQDNNLALLKSSLENFEHSFHWMSDSGSKESAIKDFILDYDINLLVMINYEHSFVERITREPIVKNIGFHPIIPFLVVPCIN